MFREREMLSQEELADRSTLSVRTIRGLESDRGSRPRGRSVRLLAEALGLADEDRERLFDAARAVPARSGPGPAEPPAAARSTPAAGVPAQLPSDVADFTGRSTQLDHLDALMAERSQAAATVVISGSAGVGKTALAVH